MRPVLPVLIVPDAGLIQAKFPVPSVLSICPFVPPVILTLVLPPRLDILVTLMLPMLTLPVIAAPVAARLPALRLPAALILPTTPNPPAMTTAPVVVLVEVTAELNTPLAAPRLPTLALPVTLKFPAALKLPDPTLPVNVPEEA